MSNEPQLKQPERPGGPNLGGPNLGGPHLGGPEPVEAKRVSGKKAGAGRARPQATERAIAQTSLRGLNGKQSGGTANAAANHNLIGADLISAGTVSRARGLSGEILVRPFNETFEWPARAEKIFLDRRAFLLSKPFLPYKKAVRFFLRGVDTRDKAEALRGSALSFLKSDFLKTAEEDEFYLFELAGFAVHVRGKGVQGAVGGFSSHKGQDILLIDPARPSSSARRKKQQAAGAQQEQIPIPFAEDYIEAIHFQKKSLHLKLPENFPGI